VEVSIQAPSSSFLGEPGLDDPLPAKALPDVGWSQVNQALHLVAHSEAVWIAKAGGDPKGRGLLVLEPDGDVQQAREL